jgi:hypothetical protein
MLIELILYKNIIKFKTIMEIISFKIISKVLKKIQIINNNKLQYNNSKINLI